MPIVTIDGNDGTETDIGSEQFETSYIFTGTEPEGLVNTIQSIVTDYLGNDGTYQGGSVGDGATTVRYDRTLPTLDEVTIASGNENTQWAKVGDEVTITSIASEPIISRSTTIQGQPGTITDINNAEFHSGYQFLETDTEGLVVFNLTFSDSAGNDGVEVASTTNSSWVVFDKTPPSNFNTGNTISTGGNQLSNVWDSTNTGADIFVPIVDNDTTIINGEIQIWGKVGTNPYEEVGDPFTILESDAGTNKSLNIIETQVESITGFLEGDSIYFKTVIIDKAGNEKEGSISNNKLVIDQTLPSINYVSYKSDFTDTTLATVGHEIILTLKTDELIQPPIITIAGQSATISDMGGG